MTDGTIKISREAYDVYVAMQLGLGSVRIAKGLGITHAAVLSRQNTLERLGVISKGATPQAGVRGEARKILLGPDQFRVEAEHRGTVLARAAADRAAAAKRDERLANLAKARAAKAARRAPAALTDTSALAEGFAQPICPITPGCDCLVAV